MTVCICSPFFWHVSWWSIYHLSQASSAHDPQVAETRASISRLADSKARTKDTKLLSLRCWSSLPRVLWSQSGPKKVVWFYKSTPKAFFQPYFSLFHTPKKGSLLCRALVSPQMLLQKDFKCMYVLYIYVHTYIYFYNLQSIDMYDQPCWCSTLYFFWILLELSWNMRVGIIEAFACLCLPVAFVSS